MKTLTYLFGKPQQAGRLKAQFADFIVKEELGYDLTGEGEFVAVKIRKTDANTLFVGEKLAEFAGISAKNMSYAGLKDRHAITEQWFCLHLAGKETPDFSPFQLEGVEILEVTRHNRKIRVGSLAGNYFELLLRDVQESPELIHRLNQIQAVGFPNYFTEQRFGRDGHNLTQAQRWASGEIKVKDRKKRSFYLSAARSEIFNLVVADRIASDTFKQVIENDIVQLAGSNSWFIAQADELASLNQRLAQGDILLTAPLVGENSLQQTVSEREQKIVSEQQLLLNLMAQERTNATRRPMFCVPTEFEWHFEPEGLRLQFFLPSGSYATALVRELISLDEETA
ncbi:tRNA pseudouridine(13) synthase TruD [Ursidibacter maritimus]|uniref:tRNA pseudouridine synthase D n=1 Tax=Ursidibacter maritimus TaxID=1331689 RepID=A0A949WGG2_9PAST|nr:tRNA pseudouridine(13) synthase TruD [Ursidibacter maritimus]KAE9541497.1 tRNA pseudouridine(13) synthase TruD [Ursidibacter maritimus]MBV6524621.1 tRNA pseudouridine(13) synthase TruD [Ursidibacter maritimus]MBV6526034.1 tRNA pseudouridine(13) synthase TruD [Ursidibacter maritimus]MBV6528335.1 tRNA pseudouridine(13) synthase TruD [Ursidibacter maritimus]MBV6529625.1 tRNA pseudouridine(13) synthase TruD [Ursidibacter maritimus]